MFGGIVEDIICLTIPGLSCLNISFMLFSLEVIFFSMAVIASRMDIRSFLSEEFLHTLVSSSMVKFSFSISVLSLLISILRIEGSILN